MNLKYWHKLTNIEPIKRIAICSMCGPVKIYSKYMTTTLWRCANRANEYRLKSKRKGKQIGKVCEICKDVTLLCWDHNHVSGKFRGTLCRNCNLAIGLFKDNPALCLQAAKYLQ